MGPRVGMTVPIIAAHPSMILEARRKADPFLSSTLKEGLGKGALLERLESRLKRLGEELKEAYGNLAMEYVAPIREKLQGGRKQEAPQSGKSGQPQENPLERPLKTAAEAIGIFTMVLAELSKAEAAGIIQGFMDANARALNSLAQDGLLSEATVNAALTGLGLGDMKEVAHKGDTARITEKVNERFGENVAIEATLTMMIAGSMIASTYEIAEQTCGKMTVEGVPVRMLLDQIMRPVSAQQL